MNIQFFYITYMDWNLPNIGININNNIDTLLRK